jgi:Uma2 family endonuclease
MGARSTRQRWTYAEFARLPSEGSTRYEILDGELVVTPAPGLLHQAIVMHLAWLLYGFVRENELGKVFGSPVDVLLAEGDYLEPDIAFVRSGRAEVLTERGIEGPPDLVVEVLSPSTAAHDRGIKLERYRLFGVPEYWLVDPEESTIEVWTLAQSSREPTVYGSASVLAWTPATGGATLEISPAEVFASSAVE